MCEARIIAKGGIIGLKGKHHLKTRDLMNKSRDFAGGATQT